MQKNINLLKEHFNKVKQMGWIKSQRSDFGGIGITFERLIGNNDNNFEIPDFEGIEIKTKRGYSKSNIGLFNAVPDGPNYHEVEIIKEKYGYPYSKNKKYKVLNTNIESNKKTPVGINFLFKLNVDKDKKKIFLVVYDIFENKIDDTSYWDFDTIEEKLYRKMKYLALVKALSRKKDKIEYFKFYKIIFYKLKSFDTFIDLIDSGVIKLSLKLSVFTSGKREGKIHDHGSSFNINENDLNKLYDVIEVN